MDVTTRKIGITYQHNEDWIGGSYYIQNLISALKTLPDHQIPHLLIMAAQEADFNSLKKLGYPNIQYCINDFRAHAPALYKRVINKINNKLTGYDKFAQQIEAGVTDVDAIFPAHVGINNKKGVQLIHWIPDFQELHYPEFFSAHAIRHRKQSHYLIANTKNKLLLSSESALKDFNTLFPKNICRKFVVPFAVTHNINLINTLGITKKFEINVPYFICSNQFWKHKNHNVVLHAVRELKKAGIEITVIFTGKERDNRNPGYFDELIKIVEEGGITANVKFLGFIDRAEQLSLMKNSLGVIQPSLFEGWSTVVEDAKSLNKPIIASCLDVHKEQLVYYPAKEFFNPHDVSGLAKAILAISAVNNQNIQYDYQKSIYNYAHAFMKVVDA